MKNPGRRPKYVVLSILSIISVFSTQCTEDNSQLDAQNKIIGGFKVETPAYFLSTAYLAPEKAYFQCGASRIAQDWVVTAAHCVTSPENVVVSWAKAKKDIANESAKINRIYSHPLYGKPNESRPNDIDNNNDIAMLYVPGLPESIQIVPVSDAVKSGDSVRVYGRGNQSSVGRVYDDTVRGLDLNVLDHKVCEESVQSPYRRFNINPELQLCAASNFEIGGSDACQGDSGGPLIKKRDDGTESLAGLVSWGLGCAQPNKPGYYTRLSSFRAWMDQIMAQESIQLKHHVLAVCTQYLKEKYFDQGGIEIKYHVNLKDYRVEAGSQVGESPSSCEDVSISINDDQKMVLDFKGFTATTQAVTPKRLVVPGQDLLFKYASSGYLLNVLYKGVAYSEQYGYGTDLKTKLTQIGDYQLEFAETEDLSSIYIKLTKTSDGSIVVDNTFVKSRTYYSPDDVLLKLVKNADSEMIKAEIQNQTPSILFTWRLTCNKDFTLTVLDDELQSEKVDDTDKWIVQRNAHQEGGKMPEGELFSYKLKVNGSHEGLKCSINGGSDISVSDNSITQ